MGVRVDELHPLTTEDMDEAIMEPTETIVRENRQLVTDEPVESEK